MAAPISYSKYPTDGSSTYNGGPFLSNDRVSTVGCSGTSCKTLAANSVFSDPVDKGTTLAPASSSPMSGGKRKSKKRLSKKMTKTKKRHLKKAKKSRNTKRKSMKYKSIKSRKRRGRGRGRGRGRQTMRGGAPTQLMSNVCYSSGYSIGGQAGELKPKEVGLAAGHFTPYPKSQTN